MRRFDHVLMSKMSNQQIAINEDQFFSKDPLFNVSFGGMYMRK